MKYGKLIWIIQQRTVAIKSVILNQENHKNAISTFITNKIKRNAAFIKFYFSSFLTVCEVLGMKNIVLLIQVLFNDSHKFSFFKQAWKKRKKIIFTVEKFISIRAIALYKFIK
jgi:hypothetical protein